MIRPRALIAICLLLTTCAFAAAPTTVPSIVRKPQWPLKDRRTLCTDEGIALARANVAKYPAAKAVADSIIKVADEWVAWDDAKLFGLIASASVPRDWGISADPKCPECHNAIQDPNGKPGWLIDPKVPFKTKCPLCNAVFPSNDFEVYYRSDFKTKIGWDTKYVDDGWGWPDPKTGDKYWFVAFANHWTVFGKLMNVMHSLGRAYLLTGDERYAHKALVALHRFAEVYPEMDYGAQSRYGALMRAQGEDYPGKIAYHTWEADFVAALAATYDACWDAIDGDEALQKFTGKTGEEIRAFVEANLLEDAMEAYDQGKIRGNYGMHQLAMSNMAIARQHGEQDKRLDALMNDAGSNFQLLGLNYALYNLFFRDGLPFESSVHYNSIWLERISQYAPLLERAGRKPFEISKMKRMYDGALAMIAARAHNPSMGDSGTVWGGIVRPDVSNYQIGYRHYHDPLCGAYLSHFDATGESGFKTFDSLLYPPVETPACATSGPTALPAQPTRLLDGYGIGILNNRNDSVAVALYYGLKAGHGHFDRLNFELFANGVPIMPDLGYPDAMNEFVPGIFTWSKNTIAHNTVTVDARRQDGNVAGVVETFVNGSFARVIDVSATGTYPQCEQYRRAMIMVDCGDDRAYFIDIFKVTGGKQHDYSLHGPPGRFELIGGQWTAPQERGTLAGENVEVGQFYDDPKLAAPGYKGGYSSYMGSGFQHFTNVRRHTTGETIAQWSHERDPSSKLRIRVLDQSDQQLIVGNARVSPVKHPELLTYLIARRQGENLSSRFVSVIEPFKDQPLIARVQRIDATTIEVERSDGTRDRITYDMDDTRAAVVRQDAEGKETARFEAGGKKSARRGDVVGIDAAKSSIRIRPASNTVKPEEFVGRIVHFENDLRRTAHPIAIATREGDDIVLTTADDLLVGRAHIDAVADDVLSTKTSLMLAPIYRGVTLGSSTYEPLARVAEVANGKIRLATKIDKEKVPAAGDDLWLINVGPGDRFELSGVADESK